MTFLEWLKSIWWLLINAGYLVFILLLSMLAFTVPAQTEDFIYVFLQDFDLKYIIAVYVSLFFWCYLTWYSACINLQIDPIRRSLDRKMNDHHINLSLLVPKLFGITPCIILAVAFLQVDNLTEHNFKVLHLIIVGSLGVSMWLLFTARDHFTKIKEDIGADTVDRNKEDQGVSYKNDGTKNLAFIRTLWNMKQIGKWPSLREVAIFKNATDQDPTFRQELIFIAQFKSVRFFYLWLGGICFVLTIALCFPGINFFLSSLLRPGAILILAIASFTLLFTIIAYFHDYTRRPFGIIVLIFIFAFSYFNDNTELKYLSNKKAIKRQNIENVFDRWLLIKKKAWEETHPGKTMPIILIATQGGGIRGLSWTTRTFHYLDSVYDGFLGQTFLISGVSGGGVGATAYLSWMHDGLTRTSVQPPYSQFNSFTKRDFLSPVTASFAFGDNFQRFLPFPIGSLERSKMLGFTWEKYYKECVGKNSFSRSFLEMWYPGKGFNYDIPSLMLNGTLAENGQRVITSNLKLKVDSTAWFEDDIDFFDFTKRDISRSYAALNCSRFPFITSGGLMGNGATHKGHIIDGGYRENTGLQTLYNVFASIRNRLKNEHGVRVIIIYLQNGSDERNDNVTASRVFQDYLVPLRGLIQVNGTGLPAKSIVQFTRQSLDASIYANVSFHILSLEDREDTTIKLPLGWYMSDIVSAAIDQRIREIPATDSLMTKSLDQLFHY